jgi:hypothetical protein
MRRGSCHTGGLVLTRLGDEPLYRYSTYTRLELQVAALRGAETCLTNRTAGCSHLLTLNPRLP